MQLASSYEVPNFKFQKITLLEKIRQIHLCVQALNEAIFAAVGSCLNLMSENVCIRFPNFFFLCRDYNTERYNFCFINYFLTLRPRAFACSRLDTFPCEPN